MFKWILKQLISIFFKVVVSGSLSKLPLEKKIYICNHESMLDALLISLFIPDKFYFVMDKTVGTKIPFSFKTLKNKNDFIYFIRNRITMFVIKFVNVIKVDTKSPHSIKTMVKLINEGKSLLIFPEGRITTTGSLCDIQPGTWFLAKKTNAMIIPLRLSGLLTSHFSYMSETKKKIFNKVQLVISDPVDISNLSREDALLVIEKLLSH